MRAPPHDLVREKVGLMFRHALVAPCEVACARRLPTEGDAGLLSVCKYWLHRVKSHVILNDAANGPVM